MCNGSHPLPPAPVTNGRLHAVYIGAGDEDRFWVYIGRPGPDQPLPVRYVVCGTRGILRQHQNCARDRNSNDEATTNQVTTCSWLVCIAATSAVVMTATHAQTRPSSNCMGKPEYWRLERHRCARSRAQAPSRFSSDGHPAARGFRPRSDQMAEGRPGAESHSRGRSDCLCDEERRG